MCVFIRRLLRVNVGVYFLNAFTKSAFCLSFICSDMSSCMCLHVFPISIKMHVNLVTCSTLHFQHARMCVCVRVCVLQVLF